MLRTLVDEGHDRPVTFLHYARTEADVIFAAELDGSLGPGPRLGSTSTSVLTGPGATGRPGPVAAASAPTTSTPSPADLDRGRGLRLRPGRAGRRRARPLGRRRRHRPPPRRALHARPPVTGREEVGGAVRFAGHRDPVASDGRPCSTRPRPPGSPRPTAAAWASATPAPAARPAARSATCAPAPSRRADEEPIQICVSVPVGDVDIDL